MNAKARLLIDRFPSPVGEIALVADDSGRLRALGFREGHKRMADHLEMSAKTGSSGLVPEKNPGGLSAALLRYFEGDLAAIEGLPLAMEGTEFQRRVWRALCEIPCGETRSYADIARRIGNPAAVRAVGLANGRNPIGIVVPCHRVIGANGTLTGYGGGIERKRWLLAHEKALPQVAQLELAAI
ncbi:MAG TPA: methylated-DNA--[protein]-cysteine S-methyltransferase [Polyangiaceae bacterium]|nr:methylated-DNA--[protein]-cysteine S-methyltransferase [Polyangiaceae bacterium]